MPHDMSRLPDLQGKPSSSPQYTNYTLSSLTKNNFGNMKAYQIFTGLESKSFSSIEYDSGSENVKKPIEETAAIGQRLHLASLEKSKIFANLDDRKLQTKKSPLQETAAIGERLYQATTLTKRIREGKEEKKHSSRSPPMIAPVLPGRYSSLMVSSMGRDLHSSLDVKL